MYLGAKTNMYLGAKRVYYKWFIGVLLMGVFVVSGFIFMPHAHAVTGINQQLNFQGRLLNAQGATVPDGYYNMQFKIYQDGDGLSVGDTTGAPTGVLDWTESYLNNNSQAVKVLNGYFSVNLGSITPFGSNINWNQSTLWLSVNIGNTNTTCTPFSNCVPDGEMVPMKRLSSTPYSLNSGMLNGLTSANFVQLAQGVQTDATTNTSSIYINKTGTGNIMELQSGSVDSFMISNAGDLTFGVNANHTLSVATAGANVAGKSLTVAGGAGGTGAGVEAGGDLLLQGGAAGGTNSTGGNVTINAGAGSGSGASGNINIGTSNASTIQIGSTTLSQTINVGNNGTGTTSVVVGAASGAAGGTTTVQSKGAMSVTSSNSTVSITAPAGTMTISSSGNSSLSATAGTMGVSGSGITTLASTGSSVGINSYTNTTINTGATPTTRATFDTSNDLYLGLGVTGALNPFTISSSGGTAGVAGSALTVQGGAAGSSSVGGMLYLQGGAGGSTSGAGGAVSVQGGNATAGVSNGGDISINSGNKFSTGTDGKINIGTSNLGTVQVGNTTIAGIQAINIGNNSTAGGTTNVIIGSGSAAAGTTTIQARDALSVTSSNSTVSITAPAGTMTISSSGNSSLSATAGTMSVSGSGLTTLTSTGNAVGLVSNGNTTFTTNSVVRGTFDTSNNLYLGNGASVATPNNFVVSGSGNSTAAGAGATLTIQGGAGNTSGSGGTATLQGGTAGASGIGGTAAVAGANGGTTSGAGGTATVTGGTGGPNSAGGATTVSGGSGGTTAGAGGNLTLQGGAGTGASGGGVVSIQGGTSGSGTAGAVNIGTTTASTVQIGNTTAAVTQAINIGNNNFANNQTTVTIGSGSSANTASTTTVQASGNVNVTSAAGILALSGNSNTITSTNTTIGLSSKTNTTIATNSATRATFDTANDLYLGNGVTGALNPFTVSSSGGTAGVAGSALTVESGIGGSSSAGGQLNLQGGAGGSTSGAGGAVVIQGGAATAGASNGGNVSIDAGALSGAGVDGNINIGANHGATIQIGSTASALAQTIYIGNNNTTNSQTNITIGSGSSSLAASSTTVQSKGAVSVTSSSGNVSMTAPAGTMTISSNNNSSLSSTAGTITLNTNGVARATFDNAGNIYFGNGVTATAPNNMTIYGTGSSTTAVTGGALTIQGGNATVGNANGGNITLSGGTGYGTGINGLVILTTPTFSTTSNDANCYTGGALVATSCTMTAASINNSSAIIVGFNTAGQTATMPDPSNTTAGRVVYITAANGSNDFTLSVNGGGTGNTIAMRQNTTATMIWNGNDWTAAGASSSTTLQSAYNNTLQSAGGAELVVSHTSNTNGLTIRDSSTNPVNGTLLSVQTASASWLLSVNDAVTEYSTDGGAETAGGSSSTFPASTWAVNGASAVSRYTTTGNYIATGQGSVSVGTTTAANDGVKDTLSSALTASMHYNVSFTTRLSSGIFTDMNVYYSIDGTTASVACKTGQAVITSVWTKVNCSFTAPASGITASNAILIRQTTGVARTFYVDNLSVTIAANYSYDTDGGVDNAGSFSTNWPFVNATSGVGSTARNTSDGQAASDSAGVTITTGAANAGISNKLSMNPLPSTLYEITLYAKLSTGTFTDFTVRYTRDGSTGSSGNYVNCVDYNTQVVTTTGWTQITCYVTTDGTAATNPYVDFVEGSSAARTFYVDTFSMTLATNTAPNVQIGGGVNGGPVTLLTLDQAASAPIASNNASLLGSMYYDTTLGKLQCYEAQGWGACGSSGDTIVTISPEYTNAVMHGTGVGTMTSDICSGVLHINDSVNPPVICGANETYNFYKWTSPQASAQTYNIYVTYQLPTTFKSFDSGQTSIMGRTDSANSTVQYQVYNNSSSGLTACGSTVSVSTGSQTSWQIGVASGAADPSTCNFVAGNSIVFMISTVASSNANAYVSNLNFAFSNK
jgi:hypothetical protein